MLTHRRVISQLGSPQIVKLLLEHGVDPDAIGKTKRGWTSLHLAVAIDNASVVEVLLNGGATIDQENKDQLTPLLYALELGSTQTARWVVSTRHTVWMTEPTQS